jgi:perosamine synthetase
MIPVCEPLIGDEEWQNLRKCVEDNWIAAGRYVQEFEQQWADYCGKRYGVAVANGTVALELAVAALELPPGSEIIMPSFTIISCALAAIRNKLQPVLVDVDPDTWCMDLEQLSQVRTNKTRAIMPVHMYGHPVDMESLMQYAESEGLYVIEDAAQAHGGEYQRWDGRGKAGSAGHMSCFSFYSNKLVTTGEGGMILTDADYWADHLRSFRNLCFGKGDDRFRHTALGHNYRMTDLQAAVGVAQIKRLDQNIKAKRKIAKLYHQLLDHPSIQRPVEREWATNVYWMYGIVLDRPAKPVIKALREKGIETRPFFIGLHEQPDILVDGDNFPVTDRLSRNGLYLPSGVALTEEQIRTVATTLLEIL